MSQNQNTPEEELEKFLELILRVGDRAVNKVLKQQGSKQPQVGSAQPSDLVSQLDETIIKSLIEDGSAQTREEAIQILEKEI
jgi:hypothetical protein